VAVVARHLIKRLSLAIEDLVEAPRIVGRRIPGGSVFRARTIRLQQASPLRSGAERPPGTSLSALVHWLSRCRRASKQAFGAQIFIQVGPVYSIPRTRDFPAGALLDHGA
jgi:hypothetical protein